MQVPLTIALGGDLAASEALRQRIEREAQKLERFSDRITACKVAVVGRRGRHRQGELYGVRLTLVMPGRDDVIVNRNPPTDHAHEDAFVAVRDAFNAARRRLQDHERRFAGRVKIPARAPHGWVSRLAPEDGFGFIGTADGREIYFHRNAVLNGGFDRLSVGAEVRFTEEEGDKGPQASTVHVTGHRTRGQESVRAS